MSTNAPLSETIFSMQFKEHPTNPVIVSTLFNPITADPTFLPPDRTPDGKWHLFAHTLGLTRRGVIHFISDDGIAWRRLPGIIAKMSLRPFIFPKDGIYYLFYEKILSLRPYRSEIRVQSSKDLVAFGDEKVAFAPKLDWYSDRASNPCIVDCGDHYRLYVSAGSTYLGDFTFLEPLHITMATSGTIDGPYESYARPLISPDKNDPWRNSGAGAIKVLRDAGGYIGFENGITHAPDGKSASAIRIISSKDGIEWTGFDREPFLKPEPGWKATHVYQLDVRTYQGELICYFNARAGHFLAKENIGMTRAKLAI